MDLIYTDAEQHLDKGILGRYALDLEISDSLTDFVLTVPRTAYKYLRKGAYIYCDKDTEFGGIITKMQLDTTSSTVEYYGLIWRGLLDAKIIEPPTGSSYLEYTTYNGKTASDIMSDVLTRCGLTDLFTVMPTAGTVAFKFDRYCTVLEGLDKLARSIGKRLKCAYSPSQRKVVLSCREPQNYSSTDYSSDQFNFVISTDDYPVNHVIALGKGELADRAVRHVYLDADGKPSTRKHYTGMQEHTVIYDYSNAEDESELFNGAVEKLMELQAGTSVEIDLVDLTVDIGDTIKATEEETGITVTKEVLGKILTMTDTSFHISYKTGDVST